MRLLGFSLALSAICFGASAQTAVPPPAARSLSHDAADQQFNFNGSAQLRISHDSMTDRRACYAKTQNFEGAWIMASGESAALISTGDRIFVDYTQPALLRIGDAAPFALSRSARPHAIAVPARRVPELVRALYTQQRVRVRIVEWPDGAIFDAEIKPGDFAAAYDRGVELCAWPKLGVGAVHPLPNSIDFYPYVIDAERAMEKKILSLSPSVAKWRSIHSSEEKVALAFSIGGDGKARDVHVSQSSGKESLDALCVSALESLQPLASLPSFPPEAAFELRAEITLFVRSDSGRPSYVSGSSFIPTLPEQWAITANVVSIAYPHHGE